MYKYMQIMLYNTSIIEKIEAIITIHLNINKLDKIRDVIASSSDLLNLA